MQKNLMGPPFSDLQIRKQFLKMVYQEFQASNNLRRQQLQQKITLHIERT